MRISKLTNWLFFIAIGIGLIYGAIYFSRRPQADVITCNNGIPSSVIEFVDNEPESSLIKFKTISSQDGQVTIDPTNGEMFGPSSMLVKKDQEVFWYITPESESVEVKATISNSCGTSFVAKNNN